MIEFQEGGGGISQKPHILKSSVRINLNFQWEGGGANRQTFSGSGRVFFQEQHNML